MNNIINEEIKEFTINKSLVTNYKEEHKESHRIKTKISNIFAYSLICMSTFITVGVLVWIIGFIFVNGIGTVNMRFLTSNYDSETQYVKVETIVDGSENNLGISLALTQVNNKEEIKIIEIEKNSLVDKAVNINGIEFPLKVGDVITRINGVDLDGLSIIEINQLIDNEKMEILDLRVTKPGKGIFPMIVTTLIMIVLSLIIACPIGIFAAIYLTEYAKPGRLVTLIRFGTESLAGIPSIIYGLFGMILFVVTLNFGYSMKAGALTLSIILLPVIIRQTEESLKAVPQSYREGSLGLGATKVHTISKAVLPSAIPGIIVAIILSMGRIIGESAALLLTAGTVARIPSSLSTSASTLTVKAFSVAKEEGDIVMACAIGTVILFIILILNTIAKIIGSRSNRLTKG